jgi:AcrR family transcriptional regulator
MAALRPAQATTPRGPSRPGRRSDEHARATKAAILARAVDVASVKGFEGLTIGSLATDLSMSKAGILGHFHSKEGLQLAVYDEASRQWREAVVHPAAAAPAGIERLIALCENWAAFIGDSPWPGGCALTPATFEFDDRPGAVRDEIAEGWTLLRGLFERHARIARNAGDLPNQDPAQVAFAIVALGTGAVQARQLHGDPDVAERVLASWLTILGRTPQLAG